MNNSVHMTKGILIHKVYIDIPIDYNCIDL